MHVHSLNCSHAAQTAGKKYNALRDVKAGQGQLAVSKCPGDSKLYGALASGDWASGSASNALLQAFQDKSIND